MSDMTLFKCSLTVLKYDMGVLTYPGQSTRFPDLVSLVQRVSDFQGRRSQNVLTYVTLISLGLYSWKMNSMMSCECTDNVSKQKYVCTILAVLISLYVNSRLNGFYEQMVFTIIIFMNTREFKCSLTVLKYDMGVLTYPGQSTRFPDLVSLVQRVSDFQGRRSQNVLTYVTLISLGLYSWKMNSMMSCECTDNVSKQKYVCTILAVLISLYVNSRLNGFHEQMVFTIIVFMNTRENIVNSRVPKTVRHGTSLHIICPKLLTDSSPSRLESIDSSPSQLKSQTSVRRPTAKLFGSSPI